MRVRDIMTEKPVTTHPDDSVSQALNLMLSGGFHHLPVISRSGHVVGIVTRRDCRIALNLPDINQMSNEVHILGSNILIREVMTKAPIVTSPDHDVFEAALLMYENHVNCLPVMLDETLVGIMTSSDLLVACIHLTRTQRSTTTSSR